MCRELIKCPLLRNLCSNLAHSGTQYSYRIQVCRVCDGQEFKGTFLDCLSDALHLQVVELRLEQRLHVQVVSSSVDEVK